MHVTDTPLGTLRKGGRGHITRLGDAPLNLVTRLMEMGFLEGSEVEVVHEAPFGRDPIAVRVRGTLVALRRQEANWVWVQESGGASSRVIR